MANKGRVTIDKEQCKGCSNCVSVCPTKILYLDKDNMNSWGYYPASVTDMENVQDALTALLCVQIYAQSQRDWIIKIKQMKNKENIIWLKN